MKTRQSTPTLRARTLSTRIEGPTNGRTEYVEHLHLLGDTTPHTLRIVIHTDSYRDQAYAHVDRWDGAQWHKVVYISGAALLMDPAVPGRADSAPRRADLYTPDRTQLLTLALEILSPPATA